MNEDEAAILGILEERRQALFDRDVTALVRHDARDILTFDLAPPLCHRGLREEERAAWLDKWAQPVELETRGLELRIGGDIAFSTSLLHVRSTAKSGEVMDLWLRSTQVFAKEENGWRVVHEHHSVPFYMDGSFRAAIDLEP